MTVLRIALLLIYLQHALSTCIDCHVVGAEALFDDDRPGAEDFELFCITKRPHRGFRETVSLTLPLSLMETYREEIVLGNAHVCIPNEYWGDGRIDVPATAANLMLPSNRKLDTRDSKSLRIGTKRLLAVRVLGQNGLEAPTETLDDIHAAIFAPNDENKPTVVSQYKAVSHGALQFVPAVGNGVVEVSISTTLADGTAAMEGHFMTEILQATAEALGGDLDELADHVIFCLPTGALLQGSPRWTAFTFLFEPYSYYQKGRCTKLSVAVHEMGHSMGYKHSGKGFDDYADESGYMGYAVNRYQYPRKAFNAHKHFISGWFEDRVFTVTTHMLLARRSLVVPLVAFVDAHEEDLPASFAAVVSIGDTMYLHYNRGKKYNNETSTDQMDLVTITAAAGETDVSYFIAALDQGGYFVRPNYEGTEHSLVVRVCELTVGPNSDIDYATLSVHLDDGVHTSACDSLQLTKESLWAMPSPTTTEELPKNYDGSSKLSLDAGNGSALENRPVATTPTGQQLETLKEDNIVISSTESNNLLLYVLFGSVSLLVLIILAVLSWLLCCRKQHAPQLAGIKTHCSTSDLDLSDTENSNSEEDYDQDEEVNITVAQRQGVVRHGRLVNI